MADHVVHDPIDLAALVLETEDQGSGAVVTFTGTVRNENDGRAVLSLTYDAHEALAEKVLGDLEREVAKRFGVRRCRIQHRVGHLDLGEPSVAIVVRTPHRDEAFEAARFAIDELKRRAPIWKQEHYADGESRFLDGVPLERGQGGDGP